MVGRLPIECVDQIEQIARDFGVSLQYSTDLDAWGAEGSPYFASPTLALPAVVIGGSPDCCVADWLGIEAERHTWHTLTLPKLTSDWAYAVALHELGHMVAGTSNEILAWAWAYKNARYWNPLMLRAACMGLSSYVKTRPHLYPLDSVLAFCRVLRPFKGEL